MIENELVATQMKELVCVSMKLNANKIQNPKFKTFRSAVSDITAFPTISPRHPQRRAEPPAPRLHHDEQLLPQSHLPPH